MFGINSITITFYHREECSTKGGASDGSCASGFGVCCVCKYLKACPCPFIHILSWFYPRCIIGSYHYCLSVALACGASASENQTYLVQASVTTLTNPCKYTICPCGTNICRIRFDFTVRKLKISIFFFLITARLYCKIWVLVEWRFSSYIFPTSQQFTLYCRAWPHLNSLTKQRIYKVKLSLMG